MYCSTEFPRCFFRKLHPAMRFFFDYRSKNFFVVDEVGMELPTLRAAAGVAAKLLAAEAEDMFSETKLAEASIEVRGARRHSALTVTLCL